MKPFILSSLFFLGFALVSHAQSLQQHVQSLQQQKNDSVCALVKRFMNEKSADKLYALGGSKFHQALSPETFKNISETNLFPLGPIRETVFEKYENGISRYKAVFPSVSLFLLISLDSLDKLEVFLFRPYTDEKAKKTESVPSSNPLSTTLDHTVDEIVRPYITRLNTVGLSIGILKDGKTYFYGYGETAKGNKMIPGPATLFEIGSVSKTFTATLLAIAIGEGRVKLNDPVSKYLPDSIPLLQYDNKTVTLMTLSNHTSGIPRMPSNFQQTVRDPGNPFSNYSTEDLYSYLKHLSLTREPAKQYEYSNTAVGLLGTILQRIYKKSYEELITKYICAPLDMSDTRVFLLKKDSAVFAKGYTETGNYNPPWDLPSSFAGAGAIRSTAADLLKYARANMDGMEAEKPATLYKAIRLTHDTTFSDGQATIGLGWHYVQALDKKVLFHGGGTGGYRTYLAIDQAKKLAVILLSNCAIGPDEEGNALMKWLEKN